MAEEILFTIKITEDGGLNEFEKRLKSLANESESIFKEIGAGITAAFSGVVSAVSGVFSEISEVFTDSVKNSIALEDAMSGVKRTANLTSDQLEILTKDVRDMSSEQLRGAVSAEELAKVLELAGQKGLISGENFDETKQKALDFTKGIATAAQALDLSFEQTADKLGKFQGIYKGLPEDIGKTANAFNILADSTDASAKSMIEIASRVAPALSSFRVAQSDIIGLSGALDALGISPYTAATALQSLFKALTANTQGFADTFGIESKKLNELVQTDITGALQLVLEHLNRMANESPAGIQNVAMALKDLQISGAGVSTALLGLAGFGTDLKTKFLDPAAEGMKNTDSITKEFINSIARVGQLWGALSTIFENIFGQFTDSLIPIMREFLTFVNDTSIAFGRWVTAQGIIETLKTTTMTFWKEALEPMLIKFVEWIKNSESLKEIFTTILPQAIRSAVASLFELTTRFDALFKGIAEGKTFLDALLQAFPELASAKDTINLVVESIKLLGEWLKNTGDQASKSKINWGELFTFLADGLNSAKKAFEIISQAIDAVSFVIDALKERTQVYFDLFTQAIYLVIDLVRGDFVRAFADLEDMVKTIFGNITNWISDGIKKLQEFLGMSKNSSGASGGWENPMTEENAARAELDALTKQLEQSTQAANGLSDAIGGVNNAQKQVEDEGWKNSVWPDLLAWIQRNEDQMGSLANKTLENAQMYARFGNVVNTTGAQIQQSMMQAQQAAAALQNTAGERLPGMPGQFQGERLPSLAEMTGQQLAQPSPVARQEQATAQAPQAINPNGLNINLSFNGTNIVDESSKNRFVREISAKVVNQTSRIVRG